MGLALGLRDSVTHMAISSSVWKSQWRIEMLLPSLYTKMNMIEIIDMLFYQIQLHEYYQLTKIFNCWLKNMILSCFLICFKLTLPSRLYLSYDLAMYIHTYVTYSHLYSCTHTHIHMHNIQKGMQFIKAFFVPVKPGWLNSKFTCTAHSLTTSSSTCIDCLFYTMFYLQNLVHCKGVGSSKCESP